MKIYENYLNVDTNYQEIKGNILQTKMNLNPWRVVLSCKKSCFIVHTHISGN